MNALAADEVCRKYGEQEVQNGFSLAIEPGGFEALMGPSGSGKSTFLHLAAGLISVDSGSIRIGETEISKLGDDAATKFRREHVGVVFQAFNLLSEKTVEENILLPLKLAGKGKTRPEGFARLVEALGIADKLEKRPEALSGGEQQRVAIARALVAEPEIVLADEPTGNLDAKSAKAICEILKSLNGHTKSAILVVTHDPVVAAVANRVHFLKDGAIAATCEPNGDAELVSRKYLETYR